METQRFAIRSRAFPLNYWSAGSVLGAVESNFPGFWLILCTASTIGPATQFADVFFEAAVKAMPE